MRHYVLKQTRLTAGITQEEMAAYLGLRSRNAYALKENGARRIYVEEAITLSKILRVPVESLFCPFCKQNGYND